MYMKKIFLLIFCCGVIQAQQPLDQCVVKLQESSMENRFPGYTEAVNRTFDKAIERAEIDHTLRSDTTLYRIPVVVHIVYNTPEQNLTDEVIRSQIEVLNEVYRRTNANASETREVFLPVAGDAHIEFYLANEDPAGNPSTGITRTSTDTVTFVNLGFDFDVLLQAVQECGITDPFNVTPEQIECLVQTMGAGGGIDPDALSAALDAVKSDATGGIDPWDPERYLNIWVCNLAIDLLGSPTPAILGFAYPPIEAPNWPQGSVPANIDEVDGVVIHYQAFGLNNPAAGPLEGLIDLGKTTCHEVGHYLGLRHIWGDGDCTMDDGIADTPEMAAQSQQDCDLTKNSCTSDSFPDMIENYMDYSADACMNMFSLGQIGIMRAMIEGPRLGLLWQSELPSSALTSLHRPLLQAYPQPASETLYLQYQGDLMGDEIIVLRNLHGQIIKQYAGVPAQLNLQELPKGTYFLQVISRTQNGTIPVQIL